MPIDAGGGGGSGGGGGPTTPHMEVYLAGAGQVLFPLAAAPFAGTLLFFVNGLAQTPTTDYTVALNVVTWLNTDFPLAVGDTILAAYWT